VKSISLLIGILMLTGFSGCAGRKQEAGVITMIVGKAWIIAGEEKREAKLNDRIRQGDAVETAENTVVIADILDGTAQVEIQQKALFRIESVSGEEKTVAIDRGNLWLRVNKLLKNGTFRMRTPTSLAAVRGTKMYHFTMGDLDGVCHCEGDVEYNTNTGGYGATHHRDNMVFVKGSATVLLTAEELAFINTPGQTHRHSDLDNSELGPKSRPLTPLQQEQLMKLISSKFKSEEKRGK